MQNKNIPTNSELPSMAQLIKSTIIAICIATILLITVVLPAEYNIDPTGVGSFIGLSKMGEIKVSLEQEAAADKVVDLAKKTVAAIIPEPVKEKAEKPVVVQAEIETRNDQMTLTLKPNEGKEIKLTMVKGAEVTFSWWTDGGKANFDAHADSKKLEIKYHNYEKGSLVSNEGTMEAAFDGNHGWFWRNRTAEDMTVTLKVSGPYTDIIVYE